MRSDRNDLIFKSVYLHTVHGEIGTWDDICGRLGSALLDPSPTGRSNKLYMTNKTFKSAELISCPGRLVRVAHRPLPCPHPLGRGRSHLPCCWLNLTFPPAALSAADPAKMINKRLALPIAAFHSGERVQLRVSGLPYLPRRDRYPIAVNPPLMFLGQILSCSPHKSAWARSCKEKGKTGSDRFGKAPRE